MQMLQQLLAGTLLACVATSAHAAHRHRESEYRDAWCGRYSGQAEVILQDGTRADCLTRNYAVEFDFAHKWPEGIGQALHYADLTGKRAAVVLIIETPKDWKQFRKLRHTARRHGVKAWYITPGQLP